MARTNNTSSSSNDNAQREALLNILLNGVNSAPKQERTLGEWIEDTATNAASTTFDMSARIGGSLMESFENAKQAYKLERNFRAAERQVKANRTVERYLERLSKLA